MIKVIRILMSLLFLLTLLNKNIARIYNIHALNIYSLKITENIDNFICDRKLCNQDFKIYY